MSSGNEVSIIILAAGSSSRMGQAKQQLPIGGESLLVKTVSTALHSAIGKVVVVLGSQHELHQNSLKGQPVEITLNAHWQTGMGSSIKAGLTHVLSLNPKTEAIIILVCDQPLLQPQHLNMLVEKQKQTKAFIVASGYSNTKGVPALFTQEIFGEILKLKDDEGAKKIIQQYPGEVVDFPEGAIDLDTPDDYKNFLQHQPKKMP